MKRTVLPPLFLWVSLPTLLAKFCRTNISRQPIAAASSGLSCLRPAARLNGSKEPLSFLIFRLDALGDVVLTTPLFRELKRAYPGSHCAVVVQRAYKPLLVTNPHVDEILTLPAVTTQWLPQGARRLLSALWLYWSRLRDRHFDFVISPRWDVDEHLATFLCCLTKAGCRLGYSEKSSPAKQRINRGFDAAFNICLPPGPVRHEVLRNLVPLEALGGKVLSTDLEIRLTERDRRRAAVLLGSVPRSARLVAIGIGAHSPGRRWPLERYAEAVTQLAREHRVHPVIVCSTEERDQALNLAKRLGMKSTIMAGAQLREVCATLERSDLFLGNDSGCAHLAAAMNCKTIVVSRHPRDGDPNHFNSPVRFAPHGAHVRVLQPATGLGDCKDACHSLEPHCITRVSVDDVVAVARDMLRETHTQLPVTTKWWQDRSPRARPQTLSPGAFHLANDGLASGENQSAAPS